MSDRWAMALAGAALVGAVAGAAVPLVLALVGCGLALGLRRPWLLCLAVALLTSTLAARSWAGLEPQPGEAFAGVVTLVSDPISVPGGLRVDVRADGRRMEARADGPEREALAPRLAGERLRVTGRVVPAFDAPWLSRRHIAARLHLDSVRSWSAGSVATRLANGLRRALIDGAEPLGDQRQALFAGLLLGDDRDQSEEVIDEFRAAGLSHLLAVSGQNVASVTALAAPLLSRLGLRARLVATLVLVGFFALVTRFEPSVLRATAMAAVAATTVTVGRPVSGGRLLSLAVVGLVIVDPLLVHSVAFRLSVGATAGILLLARRIADRLPGPRVVAQAVAITVAAQAGVAPVAIPVFGGLPLVAVPANVLAGPAAGPVVMWGLSGGLIAGLMGGRTADLLHVPTGLGVGWIAFVAERAAALDGIQISAGPALALASVVAVVALVRRVGRGPRGGQ